MHSNYAKICKIVHFEFGKYGKNPQMLNRLSKFIKNMLVGLSKLCIFAPNF